MARKSTNINRKKAFKIYKKNNGNITAKEIANQLNEKVSNINYWKRQDCWSLKNKGGAPKGNINALKHGGCIEESRFKDKKFLAKFLPASIANTIMELNYENPLDLLWNNIIIQQAKILHMQKIIYVKDINDTTKELKKVSDVKISSKEYEIQFAWDKETAGITALSKAMQTLFNMIKQYDEMVNKNWDLVTEEQRLRIETLKSKLKSNDGSKEDKIDKYFAALEGALRNDQ